LVQPLSLNSSQTILTAPPTTYVYPQQTSITSASSSPLQQQNTTEDDGTYGNGFVSAYQPYPGQIQTIYAQTPSVDLKDSSLITSTNVSNGDTLSSTTTDHKPPGTQLIAAPQYVQQQQTAVAAQHQKRSAIADPKTGIPMAAYPLTAFSYPSPSTLPMQFQQPYLTAMPMTFTGYTSHLPRL
jgi:hypothetical protein